MNPGFRNPLPVRQMPFAPTSKHLQKVSKNCRNYKTLSTFKRFTASKPPQEVNPIGFLYLLCPPTHDTAVWLDYVECRISTSQQAIRLLGSLKFLGTADYVKWTGVFVVFRALGEGPHYECWRRNTADEPPKSGCFDPASGRCRSRLSLWSR